MMWGREVASGGSGGWGGGGGGKWGEEVLTQEALNSGMLDLGGGNLYFFLASPDMSSPCPAPIPAANHERQMDQHRL